MTKLFIYLFFTQPQGYSGWMDFNLTELNKVDVLSDTSGSLLSISLEQYHLKSSR